MMTETLPVTAGPGIVQRWHRPLLTVAAMMAVCAAVTAVLLAFDQRTITGSPAWLKPLKFEISLGLYAATLAWMIQQTPRARRVAWWAGTIAALTAIGEMAVIILQAARSTQSHFNMATPLDSALWSFMGTTVVVLWSATFVLAIIVSRNRHLDPATRWGIRFGIAVSLAGMLAGFLMTGPTPEQRRALSSGADVTVIGGHSVGVPDGGPGLPVTGWSTTGGDLRIPHFVGLHALQGLPLLALLLSLLANRYGVRRLASAKVRVRLVWVGAAAWTGLFGILLGQALRGQPLLRPDGQTWLALGALVVTVAVLAVAILNTARDPAPQVDRSVRW